MVIGFWKRLVSDFLDAVFLAGVGFLLSLVTGDLFFEVGSQGAWIGLVISFLYTGLLQTSLGRGQSMGKKILGIQVLAMDGSYLSFPKSFLRYGVLAFFVYNQAIAQMLGLTLNLDWTSILYTILVFCALLGCFLMVPIHPLKRGLHDLVAGSLVVKKGTYTSDLVKLDGKGKTRAKVAYGVWGGACLLLTGAGAYFFFNMPQFPEMDKLLAIGHRVSQETDFMNVSVTLNTTHYYYSRSGNSSTTVTVSLPKTNSDGAEKNAAPAAQAPDASRTILTVTGYLPKNIFDSPQKDVETAKAAALAAQAMEGANPLDGIRVTTRKGYNIGIWSFNYSNDSDFKADGTPVEGK